MSETTDDRPTPEVAAVQADALRQVASHLDRYDDRTSRQVAKWLRDVAEANSDLTGPDVSSVKAEAWDEGVQECYRQGLVRTSETRDEMLLLNPYRAKVGG